MSVLHQVSLPQAMKKGATKEEVMEVIWIAAEMRAGASYAHATIAMETMDEANGK